jgi:uncharacterized membrane protein YbhN (UPF0104 family)
VLARTQALALTQIQAVGINLSAVFYGLFLPGGSATAWLVRLLRLAPGASGIGAALLVLTSDRAVTTAAGASIGAIAGILMVRPVFPSVTIALIAIACAAGLLTVLLLTRLLDRYVAQLKRLPGVGRIVRHFVEPGSSTRTPAAATMLAVVWLSVALHAAGIAGWWILARAIGLEIDVATIAWIRSAALVVTLIPATVGGLGVREAAVVYLMTELGVPSVDALTLSLLAFATTVAAIGMLGGAFEAFRLFSERAVAKS